MKRSMSQWIALTFLSVVAVLFLVIVGARRMQERNIEQQVMTALQNDDIMQRMDAFAQLRDTHGSESLSVIVQALDKPDDKIRRRAGSALALFHDTIKEIAPALVAHLQSSPYADVRLGCAIMLMSVKSPEVYKAYIQALHDPFDKVAQIACMELANDKESATAASLFPVLEHPSWRVRLEACKALITLNVADRRIVSTLEKMREEPEAAVYDAEIEDFDRRDKELGSPDAFKGRWGKLSAILDRARHILKHGSEG